MCVCVCVCVCVCDVWPSLISLVYTSVCVCVDRLDPSVRNALLKANFVRSITLAEYHSVFLPSIGKSYQFIGIHNVGLVHYFVVIFNMIIYRRTTLCHSHFVFLVRQLTLCYRHCVLFIQVTLFHSHFMIFYREGYIFISTTVHTHTYIYTSIDQWDDR